MGKAVGATGNVDAMAEALAKYKEVKTELNPPSPKVFLDPKKIKKSENFISFLSFRKLKKMLNLNPRRRTRLARLLKRWISTRVVKRKRRRKRKRYLYSRPNFIYFILPA